MNLDKQPSAAPAVTVSDASSIGFGDGPHGTVLQRLFRQQTTWIFVVLLVLVAFSGIATDNFLSVGNFTLISQNLAFLAVIAVGMTFVIITSGIDLSVGSVMVFSCVISAKTMTLANENGVGAGLTLLLGVAAAVLAGAVWGLVNGFLVAKAKVPPLIATLGTLSAALGMAQVISKGTDIGIRRVAPQLVDFGLYTKILAIPSLIVVAVAIILLGGIVLHKTKFGRYTYAIGSNEEAARRVGIKVDRHLIKVYLLAGILSGVAAAMYLAQFGTTSIGGGTQINLNVITAVVIGGTSIFGGIGTMIGTVIGLYIPPILQSGLIQIDLQPFWQLVAVGFVLISAVYVDQTRRAAAMRGARRPSSRKASG